MFKFNEEDEEIIRDITNDIAKELNLSEYTASSVAAYEVALLNIAEDINDKLSERETASKLENIRKTIISSLIGFLYGITPGEKLAECTYIFLEHVKEKYSDSSKRPTNN